MGDIILSLFKINSIYPDNFVRPKSQRAPVLAGNKIHPQARDEFLDCFDPDSGVAAELSQIIHQKPGAFSETIPSNITLSTLAETRCHSVNINPFPIQFLDKLRENQPVGNKEMAMIRSGSPELNAKYQVTFFVNEPKGTALLFRSQSELSEKLLRLFMDVLDDHAQYSLNREIKYTHHCWMICESEQASKRRLAETIDSLAECCMGDNEDSETETLFLVMLAYLDRYLTSKLDHLHFKNINQLILSTALLAGKWLEDNAMPCGAYAPFGGMRAKDLAELEMLFAKDINFDFHVSAELIEEYRQGLFHYTPLSLENRTPSPVSPLSF